MKRFDFRDALAALRDAHPFEISEHKPQHEPQSIAERGRFLTQTFADSVGSRNYRLYVPSGYCGRPLALVVMMHGCTQTPEDFAAGTQMNGFAERENFFIAYPEQSTSAHLSKCWNWYEPRDQTRGRGEPAIVAGITLQIARAYAIDPARIFIAGLSAGGAAAAVMAATYPELFSALGVHSGLACGLANDLVSAFAAMRGESASTRTATRMPTIVFHGDRDTTVHPRNGERFAEEIARRERLSVRRENGRVPNGHAYARETYADASGTDVFERWTVHGAGHAWSGGSANASFTDPRGPDASAEIIRFFFDHPRAT